MKNEDKTKEQLIAALVKMRQRVAELEALEAERQRAEEALRQRTLELTLLDRVGQEFTAALDLQQVTEQLLRAVTELVGAEGASVWLGEETPEGWLVCRTAYHHGQKRTPINLRLRPGQGIAGWVAQNEESTIVPNVQDDPRFFPGIDEQTGFRTSSLLAVPLWTRDRVIGVLEVVNKLDGGFDGDDCALVETLAASAAIAMDNARLVETLRQRTVDLQACCKRRDTFARVLAGDLRGPLETIVSFAQVLEDDYAALPDEELRRYLHTIAQKGRDMVGVIDELLAVQAGLPREIEEEIGPLDMASVVAEALERLSYVIEEHQAEIILPESWPVALGHGPWVEEVWVNYLSNAIKYGGRPPRVELGASPPPIPPSGVSLSIPPAGASPSIPPAGGEEGGQIRFWVLDNGPGLTPEEQVRLFAPAARRDRVRDAEYGLGLALVQRIVEKLGGQVGVESEVGRGSVFFFTLPVAE